MLLFLSLSIVKDSWKTGSSHRQIWIISIYWFSRSGFIFLNVFLSPSLMFFLCLELGQFIRRQEEKSKRKMAISLSSSSEMGDLDNCFFPTRKWKYEYWTSVKCCNLPVSPLVFSFLGPWHSLNGGAQPPLQLVLLYLSVSMGFTVTVFL